MGEKEKVYAALVAEAVPFRAIEHKAAFTVTDLAEMDFDVGAVCKNLFLRDRQGDRHFLLLLPKDKQADFKSLQAQLNTTPLSMASAERLERYLGVTRGAVSPFGLLNDREKRVELLADRNLLAQTEIGVHPNDNTVTLLLAREDLLAFFERRGYPVTYVSLQNP